MEYRLSLFKYLADETADRAIKDNGQIVIGPGLAAIIEEREQILRLNQQPIIYIVDPTGKIIYTVPQVYIEPKNDTLPSAIMKSDETIQKVKIQKNSKVYIVKSPIVFEGKTKGWVVIAQEEAALKEVNQDHELLAIMIVSILILGCGVILALSVKISKPIRNVANAAAEVREGNYDIKLNSEQTREEEIYELIESFKTMTTRLNQMERLRAELLAGVTHDLKTPVTSISGLIQAVKDDVVTGQESKEFLDISLKETQRLQDMIEDLLNYNALSAGSFTFLLEKEDMNQFLDEIAHRWKVTQDDENFDLELLCPDEPLFGEIDALRMQQIILNLLNNAKQALTKDGKITIRLYEYSEAEIAIDISDNGTGIPKDEQEYIFEPFYRGSAKKLQVRGLGLGLPFSRMLARGQNGNLLLRQSDEKGTTFTLLIEKSDQSPAEGV